MNDAKYIGLDVHQARIPAAVLPFAGPCYRNGYQELLLRSEYLAAENRILKAQIRGRLLLSQEEKATSAQTFRDFRKAQSRKLKLEKPQEHLHGNDGSPQKKRRAPEGASLLVGLF